MNRLLATTDRRHALSVRTAATEGRTQRSADNSSRPRSTLILPCRCTRPLQTSPEIGADTAIWLASSPEADGVTNQFLAKRTARPCAFRDPAARERLAKLCEQAVANGADAKLGD